MEHLTEGDKKRIAEEEAYREELRVKLRDEEKYRSHLRKGKIGQVTEKVLRTSRVIILIIFGLFVLYSLWYFSVPTSPDKSKTYPSPSPIENNENQKKEDLVGNVNFDGIQFHLTNQENVDWESCWITLNSQYYYPSNAPAQRFTGVKAGETMDFVPGEFTKRDGTRFNAYQFKPQGFSMDCDGRFGYWSW